MVTNSRVLRVLPAALLALGLAACSTDEPAPGASTSTASASGAPGTPSDSPSEAPATPSVVPATGQELSVEAVSMRLLDSPDWNVSQFGTTFVGSLRSPSGGLAVTVQDIKAGPGRTTEDKAVSFEQVSANEDPAPKRVANRVVDGVDCFVLEGRNAETRVSMVGGVVNGRFFLLEFQMPVTMPDGDQLIEQMLASVDIKDDRD